LQIDTDSALLLIITNTADELFRGTNIDLEIKKIAGFSVNFFVMLGCKAHLKSEFFAKITGDRSRQPARKI